MSRQVIHDLMAQIGPVLDLGQVTEFADDNAWLLAFDEGTRFDLEYDDAARRIVITGEVGPVDAHARPAVFEALLKYNYLWTEHGGVRAALDGEPGSVVLMVELPIADLDLPRLCQVLQVFRNVVQGWREVIAAIASGGGDAPRASPPIDMIRV